MRSRGLVTSLASIVMALTATTALANEVVLKAVTGVPGPSPVAKVFLEYVERVNERGAGVIKIDYIGGPEATPASRQGVALTRGIIDILYAPSSFYAGSMKEVDALLAVNRPMSELRTNGAFELLDERYGEQMNAYMFGWFDSTVNFNLYTTKEPKVVDGKLRLDGMRMFTTPTYRDLQRAVGADPVAVDVGEIMTALERGVIDGFAWPNYGLAALGFGREAEYRIEPTFYSGNTPALINKDKWESLPEEARKIMTEVAIEWEADVVDYLAKAKEAESNELVEGGMKIYQLEGEAADAYIEVANSTLRARLENAAGDTGKRLWDLLHKSE